MTDDDPTERDLDESGRRPAGSVSRTNRRSILRTVGALALPLTLAGCADQSRRHEADPVALDGTATNGGYDLVDRGTVEVTETGDADGTTETTLENHVAQYARSGAGFIDSVTVGLASTPTAETGVTHAMAERPLADVLTDDETSEFRRQMAIQETWQREPRVIDERAETVFDRQVRAKTLGGVTGDDEFALLNVVRVRDGQDTVLVGDARTTAVNATNATDGAETPLVGEDGHVTRETVEESAEMFSDVLPRIVHGRRPDGDVGSGIDVGAIPGRIPMAEVPARIRRRAARFIEYHSGDDPRTWSEAGLADHAHPVSRPDVDGVAYYELEVEPEGYIVCSTGSHDVPVPNFGTEGTSIGRSLAAQADGELAALQWIDRLRFVAEDADGEPIAARGNPVPRLEGVDALAERAETVGHVRVGPEDEESVETDDEVTEEYEPAILAAENDHDPPEEFGFANWESYDDLKENYTDVYGPLLDGLRERAAAAWERLREFGRSVDDLQLGETHREPLLDGQTVETLSGTAAEGLEIERLSRDVGHDVVEITPTEPDAVGQRATLELADDAGVRERFEYRIGDEPAAAIASETPSIAPSADEFELLSAPGGDKYWAGGSRFHTWYYQHDYQNCPVGCGPVAWGLLIGWCDRQAAGGKYNSTWWPRWGLYRRNGGRGADRKAPKGMTSGVKNMLEELHHHVNVFCINPGFLGSKQGATAPWDMDGVVKYLNGRTGTSYEYWWGGGGLARPKCKNEAVESIKGNANNKGPTPTIVGKGWLSHYPLAYAYSDGFWGDHFKVNNGWGKNTSQATEWIDAGTWFSGEFYP